MKTTDDVPGAGVPRLARLLLALFLPRSDRRFALSDLDEEFEERAGREGLTHARRWYRKQALRSVGPLMYARMSGRWSTPHRVGDRETGSRRNDVVTGRWGETMQMFLSDIRFGLRSLRRSPVAVAVTVLSLGIGIGAMTASFAVANAFLFPPPVGLAQPERLVTLYTSEDDGGRFGDSSFPDYLEMAAELDAVEGAVASSTRSISLNRDDRNSPLLAEEVTANYFEVTGMRAVLGRTFTAAEAPLGAAPPIALIGHDLWVGQFGADPGIVGSVVKLSGTDVTVIGVTPDGAMSREVPLEPDVWLPLSTLDPPTSPRTAELGLRDRRRFLVLARLKPEATLEQVQAQADVLSDRLVQEYPIEWTDQRDQARAVIAVAEKESRVRPGVKVVAGGVGLFFIGTTGLILLIACSNVTSLFLARGRRRAQELAVRASLGASRSRLISMLVTEALIPGVAAGLLGVLIAGWAVGFVNGIELPVNLPIRVSVDLDGRVLLFALLTSVGTSLVFGLIPALEGSRTRLVPALKGDAVGGRHGRIHIRNLLVVLQCAASLVLLVGATLFIRALGSATETDLGVDPDRVAVATKTLALDAYDAESGTQYLAELKERLAARPGVETVEMSRGLELTLLQLNSIVEVTVDGEDPGLDRGDGYFRNAVTPGYLAMLGIPLLRGRGLLASDTRGAPLVAVVNETLADRFWPGEQAIGQRFEARDPMGARNGGTDEVRTFEVVGVAGDGQYGDYDDPPLPYFWTSFYQEYSSTVVVSAKGIQSAEAMIPILKEGIELDQGELQLLPPATYASQISIQFIHLRVASRVLSWGGAFGLFLAIIGIYGVVSFAVTLRTREMAVRIALGAEQTRVVRTIVRDGVRLALIGLGIGLLVALPVAHLLSGVLVNISPMDPLAFGGGLGVLLASAFLASLIPALRATRIDPMKTLREE